MKILIDYHHFHKYLGLYHLLEETLGHEIYYPFGEDWATSGYWNYSDNPDLILSLLRNTFKNTLDIHPVLQNRQVRLEDVKEYGFDIIVPTVPHNLKPFRKLISDFGLSSKLLFVSGNNFPKDTLVGIENLLTAATGPWFQHDCHKCFFHQWFDTELFKPQEDCDTKLIINLQHFIGGKELELLLKIEESLPDWTVKIHGCGNRDGSNGHFPEQAASLIRGAGFLYHVKRADEGYGFNGHYSLACGKPLIIGTSTMSDVWTQKIPNTLSSKFDENTIVDVDTLSFQEVVDKLVMMEQSYRKYSKLVYEKFVEKVDFIKESENVKIFMENLV